MVADEDGRQIKWFAAAKDVGLCELALTLARKSPVDHRTLTRAAKDFAASQPHFAVNCALTALYWICAGHAYDVTTGDILAAYEHLLEAAGHAHCTGPALQQLRRMLDDFAQDQLVRRALAGKAALWRIDPTRSASAAPDQ